MGLLGKRVARCAVAVLLGVVAVLTGTASFAVAANSAPAEQALMVADGETVDQEYLKAHGLAVDDTFHVVLAGSAVFDNVSVNSEESSAVLVTDPDTMILVKGATSFVGAENCAGIEVPEGKKVTIKGKEEGTSLIAVGNHGVDYGTKAQAAQNKKSCAAGIGATKANPACGEIIIKDIDGKLSVRGCGVGAAGIGSVRAAKADISIKSCNLQGIYGGCQVAKGEKPQLTGGPAIGGGTEEEPGGSIELIKCTGADVAGGSNAIAVGYGAVKLDEVTTAFGADGTEVVETDEVVDIQEQETALAAPDLVEIDDGQGTGSQIDSEETDTGNVGSEVDVVDDDEDAADDTDDTDDTSADEDTDDADSVDVEDDEDEQEEELETPPTETGELIVYAGFILVLAIAAAAAIAAVVAYRRGKAKPPKA